jgi:quinol-cytochrome oxidoreductase complex cytochrome b subunit
VPQERAWLIATRVALGLVAALLIVMIVTGIALTFRYQPDVTDAYANVGSLQHHSSFTARRVHQVVSTLFLVAVGFLAIASIGLFLVRRRRASILLPLLAGFSALVASFTGFLLPWDQLSLWAVTVGTNMRGYEPILRNDHKINYVLFGNRTTAAATLRNEYWLHAVAIPIVIIGLLIALWFVARRSSKLRTAPDD